MGKFSKAELESAFQKYWRTGAVNEDWDGFANNFTQDAHYIEHVLGTMHGREKIRSWIKPIMEEYCELYTAYEWHTIDEEAGRAIVYMQNRRDHPSGVGTIDFPGDHDPGVRRRRPLEGRGGLLGRSRLAPRAQGLRRGLCRSTTRTTSRSARATTGATARPGRAARRPGSSDPARSASPDPLRSQRAAATALEDERRRGGADRVGGGAREPAGRARAERPQPGAQRQQRRDQRELSELDPEVEGEERERDLAGGQARPARARRRSRGRAADRRGGEPEGMREALAALPLAREPRRQPEQTCRDPDLDQCRRDVHEAERRQRERERCGRA